MPLRHTTTLVVAATAALLLSGCGSDPAAEGGGQAGQTGAIPSLPEPSSQDEIRPGVSAADCDNPDVALTQASGPTSARHGRRAPSPIPTRRSSPTPMGCGWRSPRCAANPTTLTTGCPNENDGYDTAAYVTLRLANTGDATIALPDSEVLMTTDLLFGVNRYDAQGWAHGGGQLPAQLVPGTSAETELLFSLPSAELGVLAFTVNPDPTLDTDYTFTDVQTLIGLPPTGPTPAPASPTDECIGYGCSPEQDAELNEAEREADAG